MQEENKLRTSPASVVLQVVVKAKKGQCTPSSEIIYVTARSLAGLMNTVPPRYALLPFELED